MILFAELTVYGLALILAVVLTLGTLFLARLIQQRTGIYSGPVYVPSTDIQIAEMLELAQLKKSDRCVDLGSGDGKLVIALAQQGYHAVGIENNPFLVWISRRMIRSLGLQERASIKWGNFWNQGYTAYSVVFVYATESIMGRLGQKLHTELKPGSRVISNHFQFPKWRLDAQKNGVHRYLIM